MREQWPLLVLLPCLVISSGCADEPRPVPASEVTITWGPPIRLQEDEQSILVAPDVTIDPQGGYLVSDRAEAQIRRYDASGALLWTSGRRGQGPGEYSRPTKVIRRADGGLIVFDMNGGTTILDPDGHYEKTLLLPFSRVDGALPLDDQAVLLRGAAYHETEIRLLHVMDLAEERVEVSFFPLPPGIPHELAISMAYAAVDVRGDTVITAFGGLDSVFVYTLDGQRQRAFEIPVDNFRVVGARPATSDPRQVQAYHGSYETMGGIWWLAPDLIAVSYKTQIPGGMDWHWAVMTNTGELVHQERSSVMLLGADPARSVLLAVSPGSEVPNTWCEINVARGR